MAIKVIDRKVREEIVDQDGNHLGEIAFNPNDTEVYSKFIEIFESLSTGKKEMDSLDLKELKEPLETLEDFENASDYFAQIKTVINISNETVDNIVKQFDSIFGEGVCEIFLNGSHDVELLYPLINAAGEHFKKARSGKTEKYSRAKSKGVLK